MLADRVNFFRLASIYFDYVNNNSYALDGFAISREASFNITSITVNDSE